MRIRRPNSVSEFRDRIVNALSGPQMLAFVPALCLAGFWLGGEATLVAIALFIPFVWMMFGGLENLVKRRVARKAPSGLIA
ncbi:MAG: diguanylate cyclase, partial [Pseudomonadota bacterium]